MSCSKQTQPAPGGQLSAAEFTEEYVNFLREAQPGGTVEVRSALELRIVPANGLERLAFLDNAFREYQAAPEDKAEIFARFAKAAPLLSPDKVARERIVPIIKDRAWMKEVTESLVKADPTAPKTEHVFDDFNEALVIVYAQDLGERLAYLSPTDLKEAAIDRADLRKLATANLKALIPEVQARAVDGLFMITAGGTYEASILLSEKFWNAPPFTLDGDPVVAIPTRDILLVTGSNNREGVQRMEDKAKALHKEGSYQLTPQLFVWRNGKFQNWAE
jgi:uncharacterized protein YtpQ (UPF0354 family)